MKIKIALFFSILFVGFIAAPTIISLVNENQDVSFFLSLNEEEENNVKKNFKEVKIYPTSYSTTFFKSIQKRKNIRFTSKNYVCEFPKILTPPPELVL